MNAVSHLLATLAFVSVAAFAVLVIVGELTSTFVRFAEHETEAADDE